MSVVEGLNQAQRTAVEATDGPVLIVAGPGTGKTKTLTARITHLLQSGCAASNQIVALTFTNKAAREMRERLTATLGEGTPLPKICTFHALGADLLQQEVHEQALAKPAEQLEIIRSLQRPAVLKSLTVRELTLAISCAKTSLEPAADDATRQLLERYEAALHERGLYDFDDLLVKAYRALQAGEDHRPHYQYVLVDEFQDTSELQYAMLKLLSPNANLFAIGDPNQSIYAFRGAGAEMFARFRADFPSVRQIALTENYRSCPEIVRLANAVFPNSPQLHAHQKTPGNVQLLQTLSEYAEAAYVLGEIEKGIGGSTMLNTSGHHDVQEPRDYAVLYRTHRAGRALQKVFAEAGVPHQIAGEGSPYEQLGVQAIMAELRIVGNPQNHSVYDLAKQIAEDLQVTTENLAQFFGTLVQFGTDLQTCLRYFDDIAEQEFYDPTVNAVTLMTVHASKGLEFSHIFLVAAEEGILPKSNATEIEEEKRLFYVATTRAKQTLTILHTKTRAGEPAKLSRFAAELSGDLLPRVSDPNLQTQEKRLQKRQLKRAQTSLF